MPIIDLLQSEDIKSVLCEFAGAHRPGMSADEFLRLLGPRPLVAKSVNSLGKQLGIRSVTRRALDLPHGLTLTGISLLCALFSQGIQIDTVDEPPNGGTLRLHGSVPSSIFHFGGETTINISGGRTHSAAEITIVYPGQLFAWGAGGRLIANFHKQCEQAADRLRSCQSLRDAIR